MKKSMVILCAMLLVFGIVGVVEALPLSESNSSFQLELEEPFQVYSETCSAVNTLIHYRAGVSARNPFEYDYSKQNTYATISVTNASSEVWSSSPMHGESWSEADTVFTESRSNAWARRTLLYKVTGKGYITFSFDYFLSQSLETNKIGAFAYASGGVSLLVSNGADEKEDGRLLENWAYNSETIIDELAGTLSVTF